MNGTARVSNGLRIFALLSVGAGPPQQRSWPDAGTRLARPDQRAARGDPLSGRYRVGKAGVPARYCARLGPNRRDRQPREACRHKVCLEKHVVIRDVGQCGSSLTIPRSPCARQQRRVPGGNVSRLSSSRQRREGRPPKPSVRPRSFTTCARKAANGRSDDPAVVSARQRAASAETGSAPASTGRGEPRLPRTR